MFPFTFMPLVGLAAGLAINLPQRDAEPDAVSVAPRSNNGIWTPGVGSSWQIVLNNPLLLPSSASATTPDVDVFDIDLFMNPASTISTLHKLNKQVICYFSAGSFEPYRPDSLQFQPSDFGKGMLGWPDEKWLNIRSPNVRRIMSARIALAAQKGCDAVDPDNMDGYNNDNGLGLTTQDSIDYMTFLSNEASNRGLAIGLKNAAEIVPNVINLVDFSVNEQCMVYTECQSFAPFTDAGKPVYHIEYPKGVPKVAATLAKNICSGKGAAIGSAPFSTVMKGWGLDGWVQYCDGTKAITPVLL